MKEAPTTSKYCSGAKPKERASYDGASLLQLTSNTDYRSLADATGNVGATQSVAHARNHSSTLSINGRALAEPVSDRITQNLSVKVN